MSIPTISSAKTIEQYFLTGEEPVLVMCSDLNMYVCKYMRSSASAYKLACELIGAEMAKIWKFYSPNIALVKIKPSHWNGVCLNHYNNAPALGGKWMDGVIDITPSTYDKIPTTNDVFYQLIKIALFDFWVANEDRNANNANLMFDVIKEQLVVIDFGCIFNTATFDYPLSQLTITDTILYSDIFIHLRQGANKTSITNLLKQLKKEYSLFIKQCIFSISEIEKEIPQEWNVPHDIIKEKFEQLFNRKWIAEVWNNFFECLNDNLNYE